MNHKKIKVYEYHWGVRLFKKINNHPVHVYVNNDGSVEIIDGLSSPIASRVLYQTSIDELRLTDHFYFLNQEIKIKWRGVSRFKVKKCLGELMHKSYKLMVFS